eukprot:3538828-Rhodomonas_salina.1
MFCCALAVLCSVLTWAVLAPGVSTARAVSAAENRERAKFLREGTRVCEAPGKCVPHIVPDAGVGH